MYDTHQPNPSSDRLPTMYDLPSEDPNEPGLPDEFHLLQPELLRLTFRPPNYPVDEFFTGSDLNLYYDPMHLQWYKRPDWFGVLGVSRFYNGQDLRMSYVTWQEAANPFVVVELLSPGTEAEDLGKKTGQSRRKLRDVSKPPNKWMVYEQILSIPYYFVFNRYTNELQPFGLMMGRYQPLSFSMPEPSGILSGERPKKGVWLQEAELGLGLWKGSYQGVNRLWLRWFDRDLNWIATPEEQEAQRANQEAQRANQEAQRAEQEAQRAERLASRLRELGIDPDDV
ncbi:MAG: Uma2 family endonuclease [Cyanobacteria bacterium P01_F01_bin.150]